MRLIDADKNPCQSCNMQFNCDKTYCAEHIEWLQTPAYDVSKVIDELELHSFEFGTDILPFHYVRLHEAIEIVKQGLKEQK